MFYIFSQIFREEDDEEYTKFSLASNYEQAYTNSAEENPYIEILSKAKDKSELRKMYHDLTKEIHPDVSNDSNSTPKQALLNDAYSLLKTKYI